MMMKKNMPRKNGLIKKRKGKNVNLEEQLAPCTICGRTFLPGPLSKHSKVCEKNAFKKRKVFNSLKQRVEGTDLAPFHLQTYLKKPEPPNKPEVKQHNQTTWKEKHQELVTTIREAKGNTHDSNSGTPNRQRSMSIMSAGFERCQTCDRQFGPKAYDRHVEWCKERKNRLPQSPANVQQAKERLEARIKYRVPSMSKPKKTVKEKYQSPVKTTPEHVPTVKSTSNLDRRPSIRKSTDKKSIEKMDITPKIEVKPKKPEPLKSSGKRAPPLKINTTQVNALTEGLTVSQLNNPIPTPKKLTNWNEIFIANTTPKSISSIQSDGLVSVSKTSNHDKLKKSESLVVSLPKVSKSKDCLKTKTPKKSKRFESFEIPTTNSVKDVGSKSHNVKNDSSELTPSYSKKCKDLKTQSQLKKRLLKTPGTKANPLPSLHIAKEFDSTQSKKISKPYNNESVSDIETQEDLKTDSLHTSFKYSNQQHLIPEESSRSSKYKDTKSKSLKEKETPPSFQIKTKQIPNFSTEGSLVKNNKIHNLNSEVLVKKDITDNECALLRLHSPVNKDVLVLTSSTQDTLIKSFPDYESEKNGILILVPEKLSNKNHESPEFGEFNLCKTFKTLDVGCLEKSKPYTKNYNKSLHSKQKSKSSPLVVNEFEPLDLTENKEETDVPEKFPKKLKNIIQYQLGNYNFSKKQDLVDMVVSSKTSDFVPNYKSDQPMTLEDVKAFDINKTMSSNITENFKSSSKDIHVKTPDSTESFKFSTEQSKTKLNNQTSLKSENTHIINRKRPKKAKQKLLEHSEQLKTCNSIENKSSKQSNLAEKSEHRKSSGLTKYAEEFNRSEFVEKQINLPKSVIEVNLSTQIEDDKDFLPIDDLISEKNQELFEGIVSKRRKIDSNLDLIPEKLVDENAKPIQNIEVVDEQSESEIPDIQVNLSFDKLNFDDIDEVIYENPGEFEEVESFHGIYNNQHSAVLSEARMEQELRSCCSEIILTNNFDRTHFITYSETDLTKFNRLQDVMKCSNLEGMYTRDRIWELAGEEFILTVKSLETIQESYHDKIEFQDYDTSQDSGNMNIQDSNQFQDCNSSQDLENMNSYHDHNSNILQYVDKIQNEMITSEETDLISFEEVAKPLENDLQRLDNKDHSSILDNILEIGCDLLQPEPPHDVCTCREDSKPFIAEIYHNCLQDNIRKIKKFKEQSSEIISQGNTNVCKKNFFENKHFQNLLVSNQTDFKEVCNVIPEETQSSLNIDLKRSNEDSIILASGDNKLENVDNKLLRFKSSKTPSSASSTEYSPRFIKLVTVILSDHLSTRRFKDELKISREDCRRLINVDPKDLPKIKKRGNLLEMKTSTSTSPSSDELVLPEIVQKKSLENTHRFSKMNFEKAGSPTSTCRDETYNPILTAERQLMELLECDDFKSFTPNKTTPQPRPKQTHSVKEINAKNLKYKRASVIDPPTDFQDNNSPDIFDENFELIENFINDNLSDDTILDKLDAISLSSHKTHLTDSENFNAFCDELSIDPRLINEYDNLSIPDHLTIGDSSPAESIPQISNKFCNVDNNKLPVLEPQKAEKSVNLNEMDDLIASVANVDRSNAKKQSRTKVVKSQQSCSFGNSTSSHDKKKNLSSLKRSISVLDPVKPKNLKNKEDVQNYFQEQEMRCSPKNNAKVKENEETTNIPAITEDLFSIDDEMYEEYKKYEQMYLLEKEEKLKQERKAQEDDSQISKISGDSAYGSQNYESKMSDPDIKSDDTESHIESLDSKKTTSSQLKTLVKNMRRQMATKMRLNLSRNKPKVRTRVAKLSPLEHRTDSASSSGSEAGIASNSAAKLSKFCHECGSRYPLHTAKFCVECGVKRLQTVDN